MDLSDNRLTGGIPGALGNLVDMQYLYLGSNQLMGTIPPNITQLTAMQHMIIDFNGLVAADPSVTSFLEPIAGSWETSQTVPPAVSHATAISAVAIRIEWRPISYTWDGGHYRVSYSTTPGGPYTPAASTTEDKMAQSLTVEGLMPNTTYHFVVQTHTPAHALNHNAITSMPSAEVTATTYTAIFLPQGLGN
jgi:hypothetical protein